MKTNFFRWLRSVTSGFWRYAFRRGVRSVFRSRWVLLLTVCGMWEAQAWTESGTIRVCPAGGMSGTLTYATFQEYLGTWYPLHTGQCLTGGGACVDHTGNYEVGRLFKVVVTGGSWGAGGLNISTTPITFTGAGHVMSFTINQSGAPSTWKLSFGVVNDSPFKRVYNVYTNGVKATNLGGFAEPGTTASWNVETTTKFDVSIERLTYDENGKLLTVDWSKSIGAGDASWTTGTPTLNSGIDGTAAIPMADVGGGIPWIESPTIPAHDETIQTGFEALYDLQAKAVNGNQAAIDALNRMLESGVTVANGHLSTINASAAAGATSQAATAASAASINTKLDTTNQKLADSYTQIVANSYATTAGAASVGAKVDAASAFLGGKFDGLNASQVSTLIELGYVNVKLDAANTKADAANSWHQSNLGAIQELRDQVVTGVGNINSVASAAAGSAQTAAAAVNANLNAIIPILQSIDSHVVGNGSLIGSLRSDVQQGNSSLGLIATHTGVMADLINQGNGKADLMYSRLGNIEGGVALINSSVQEVKGAVEGLEPHLDGIRDAVNGTTNWLAQILNKIWEPSDAIPGYDGYRAQGETAANDTGASYTGIAADWTAIDYEPAGAVNDVFLISLMGYTVNVNPLANATVAEVAAWLRYLLSVFIAFGVVYFCVMRTVKAVDSVPSWNQSKGVLQKLGPLGKVISWGGGTVAGLITVAAGRAVPAAFLAWAGSHVDLVALAKGNPFAAGWGSTVSAAVWLLDQIAPIKLALSAGAICISYAVTLASVVMVKSAGVRMMPA